MITDGQITVEERLPTMPENSRFWVIGCLKAYADSYQYVAANLFTTENPILENGRYCNNLFMDSEATTFPENVFVKAIIRNGMDNSPVMGATVQVLSSGSTEGIQSGVTDGSGIARIPVYNNGTYAVFVNGDAYENSWDLIDVVCADSNCQNEVLVIVAPTLDDDAMMINLKWFSKNLDMKMMIFKVEASSADVSCGTGINQPDNCDDIRYVYDTQQTSVSHGGDGDVGGDAVIINNLGSTNVHSYLILVTSTNSRRAAIKQATASSVVTVIGRTGTLGLHDVAKISISKKFEIEFSLRGALLYGEWTTVSEIFTASEEQQRNTLIVQLASWSSLTTTELQAMTNAQLIDFAAISGFLKVFGIHTQSALTHMNLEDQTNSAMNTMSHNSAILSQYRFENGNQYLGSADLRAFLSTRSGFSLVGDYSSWFTSSPQTKKYWIPGCVKSHGSDVSWVPVGEFVADFDMFFCHNLLYSDLPEPTTTTTQAPFYDNVGIQLIARNSQNNNAVAGATGSVSLEGSNGMVAVVNDAQFDSAGRLFVPVSSNGQYTVQVKADGFINADLEVVVACTSANCPNEKLLTMSPVMPPGQTRIMISWETEYPEDVDTHVMAVKRSDNSLCKTWYSNTRGCASVSQDLDNTDGGLNGAETVTLLDNAINKDYRYMVAIHDYNFESSGVPFLNSGSSMTVTNGAQTVNRRLEASGPITETNG